MQEREIRALAALVRALIDGARVGEGAWPVEAVRRHLLAPLAYRAGAAGFRKEYVTAVLQEERREAFLIEAIGAVRVPVMLLKGIAYAGDLYGPGERPMTDIDLLVEEARFDEAAAGLRRAGYRDDGKRNQRSPVNHAVTFRRQESAVDLHRSMVQRGRMGADLAAVWREARAARHGALRPAPVHEYLMHVAHVARHEGTVALVAFVDAARLRARAPGVEETARTWRMARAVAIVEGAVAVLRGGSPHGWEGRVFPGRDEMLRGGLPPRWLQLLRKAAIHDSVRDVVAFAGASVRTRLGV